MIGGAPQDESTYKGNKKKEIEHNRKPRKKGERNGMGREGLAIARSEGSPDGRIDGDLQSKFPSKIAGLIKSYCATDARIRGPRREVVTHPCAVWSCNTNGYCQYADSVIHFLSGRGRLDSCLATEARGEIKQWLRGCRTDGSAEPRWRG